MILKGQKDRVESKVVVDLGNENGRPLKVEFVAVFRKAKTTEAEAILKQIREQGDDFNSLAFLREYLVGWHGLKDAEDNDVQFNDDTFMAVYEVLEYRNAVRAAAFDAVFSSRDARAKN